MDKETADLIAKMAARIAMLERMFEDFKSGVELGYQLHDALHRDLDQMAYMTFYRTHPECAADFDKANEIMRSAKLPERKTP